MDHFSLLFIAGLIVGGFGAFELLRGVGGDTATAGNRKLLAIVRLVTGGACALFGLYKTIF